MSDATEVFREFEQLALADLGDGVRINVGIDRVYVYAALELPGFPSGGSISAYEEKIDAIAAQLGLVVVNKHTTYKDEYDDFSAEVIMPV